MAVKDNLGGRELNNQYKIKEVKVHGNTIHKGDVVSEYVSDPTVTSAEYVDPNYTSDNIRVLIHLKDDLYFNANRFTDKTDSNYMKISYTLLKLDDNLVFTVLDNVVDYFYGVPIAENDTYRSRPLYAPTDNDCIVEASMRYGLLSSTSKNPDRIGFRVISYENDKLTLGTWYTYMTTDISSSYTNGIINYIGVRHLIPYENNQCVFLGSVISGIKGYTTYDVNHSVTVPMYGLLSIDCKRLTCNVIYFYAYSDKNFNNVANNGNYGLTFTYDIGDIGKIANNKIYYRTSTSRCSPAYNGIHTLEIKNNKIIESVGLSSDSSTSYILLDTVVLCYGSSEKTLYTSDGTLKESSSSTYYHVSMISLDGDMPLNVGMFTLNTRYFNSYRKSFKLNTIIITPLDSALGTSDTVNGLIMLDLNDAQKLNKTNISCNKRMRACTSVEDATIPYDKYNSMYLSLHFKVNGELYYFYNMFRGGSKLWGSDCDNIGLLHGPIVSYKNISQGQTNGISRASYFDKIRSVYLYNPIKDSPYLLCLEPEIHTSSYVTTVYKIDDPLRCMVYDSNSTYAPWGVALSTAQDGEYVKVRVFDEKEE